MPKKNTTLDSLALMVKKGFDHVDDRFEEVGKRFDKVEVRLESLEKGQQALFAAVRELPSPEAFLRIRKDLTSLKERVSALETKGRH